MELFGFEKLPEIIRLLFDANKMHFLDGIYNGVWAVLGCPCGPSHLLYLLSQRDAAFVPDRAVVYKIGILICIAIR